MIRLLKFHQAKRVNADQFVRFKSNFIKKSSLFCKSTPKYIKSNAKHKSNQFHHMSYFSMKFIKEKFNEIRSNKYIREAAKVAFIAIIFQTYYAYKEEANKEKISKKMEALDSMFTDLINTETKEQETDKIIRTANGRYKPVKNIKLTFKDIQGCDEAKHDLQYLVDFLENPKKYTELGATLPKGVILFGPPGVGKTSLAKAVAGEANVPFLYVNSSEFDEMYVGVGASRVRELFDEAKKQAPCVIFLDELDAVGSKRGINRIHNTQNQTISQLLTELDGFHQTEGILVLAATNNKVALDPALIRSGRFDVEIDVLPPDFEGRVNLFQLYLDKVRKSASIDLNQLANGSIGFTGATIKNMVNQAAIQAGILNEPYITMEHLWHARDKIIMGTPRKRINDESTNRKIAFHEAGHALISYLTEDSEPLHKVTIIPRKGSLGHTSFLRDRENYTTDKSQLQAKIDTLMGGRLAEEMIYGKNKVTTGASQDLERATGLAEQMVLKFGMSEQLGYRTFDAANNGENSGVLSPETKQLVDKEVEQILHNSYKRVKNLLDAKKNHLVLLAETLLVRETLNREEVTKIIEGGSSSDFFSKLKIPSSPSSFVSSTVAPPSSYSSPTIPSSSTTNISDAPKSSNNLSQTSNSASLDTLGESKPTQSLPQVLPSSSTNDKPKLISILYRMPSFPFTPQETENIDDPSPSDYFESPFN